MFVDKKSARKLRRLRRVASSAPVRVGLFLSSALVAGLLVSSLIVSLGERLPKSERPPTVTVDTLLAQALVRRRFADPSDVLFNSVGHTDAGLVCGFVRDPQTADWLRFYATSSVAVLSSEEPAAVFDSRWNGCS